ncbi:Hemin import ATP-binding protein HmuV [Oligella sp. MSHR50489EDL]|uniref:ATP-binding cassette domain-containing protein n=1 Tax=Oligella sp. MSHR50489EDL TaxID=3139409 RepID=UPI003D8153CC
MSAILVGQSLSVMVGHKRQRTLLDRVSVAIEQGQFTAIMGANGAGKTTLLNLLNGDNIPQSGQVLFKQQVLQQIDRLALARQRAVLPQLDHVPFAITAAEIIGMGREPFRHTMYEADNTPIVQQIVDRMALAPFLDSSYNSLSGGEQHRVQIARTLAQVCPNRQFDLHGQVLFLDEPTNHLDIRHQYALMYLLKELQAKGLTIVVVMHDINLSLQFSDQIILLKNGVLMGQYTPDSLVGSEDLSRAYDIHIQTSWHESFKRYLIAPVMVS